MKKLLFAALAAATAFGSANAQTIGTTPLRSISISGQETLPVGLAYHAATDTVYIVGFNQRRIVRIANPTATTAGSPEIFAYTSSADTPTAGPVVWDAGRGLMSARISGNTLIVAGDVGGTAANGALLTYDLTATAPATPTAGIHGATQLGGTARRFSSADFFGSNIVFVELAQDRMALANTGLTATVGAAQSGFLEFRRHVVAVGSDLYVTIAGNSNPENIALVSGGTTTDLSGKTVNPTWYSTPQAIASAVRFNASYWNYTAGSKQYLVVNQTGTTVAENFITFVDIANPGAASPLRMTNASHGLLETGGAIVVTVGGQNYLLVTANNTGGGGARLDVYSIDGSALGGATEVDNWTVYN